MLSLNLPLRSAMLKLFKFLFLFAILPLYAQQELEVRLETKVPLKPIYVSRLHTSSDPADRKYPEEMRGVLSYDLSNNGYSSVTPVRESSEQKINWPNPRESFDRSFWKKEQIPFVLTLDLAKDKLNVTIFSIEKGSSKRYSEISLSGKPEIDRPVIHKLADAIQKDLFGTKGVASLHIIFSQRGKNPGENVREWHSEIWSADWDGANAKRLTSAKGYCMSPGFLPYSSADSYLFVSNDRGQSKIYKATLSDPKAQVWINMRGNQMLPAVDKTGSQIAFITDVAGRPDLFIQNLDHNGTPAGQPRQLFSAPNATQASPTFSPDGHKVAFVSDKDGSPKIYFLEIRDPREERHTDLKLITRKNRENTSPAWSPDGKHLAYSSRTDGVRQIWIYDFDTNEEWPLTSGPENKENASWAPDSLHLVYNTETQDICELYMINLHQQEPIKINLGFGQKRFAAWEHQ